MTSRTVPKPKNHLMLQRIGKMNGNSTETANDTTCCQLGMQKTSKVRFKDHLTHSSDVGTKAPARIPVIFVATNPADKIKDKNGD